jgi:FAD/FMN-containing dehydrogenase
LLTVEVVYGTGDDFRTGSACGPGTLETLKADKVNPWGPGSLDYFRFLSAAQGTMGLVTWAVTKAEVLPARQKLYFVGADDVSQITGPINELLRQRVVDECLVLNRVSLATMLAKKWTAELADVAAALPAWVAILCVAGYARRPDERIAIQERYLRDICSTYGVLARTSPPGAEGREAEVLELISNVWTRDSGDWKLRARGSSREIFFLAPISKIPPLIGVMNEVVAASNYPVRELGCYVQPMVQGRGCHCEFIFPCDESHAGEMEELRGLLGSAAQTLMKHGAFFSRPYGPLARMVYDNYPEGVAALRTLKGVFDPNNILNPGKLCF